VTDNSLPSTTARALPLHAYRDRPSAASAPRWNQQWRELTESVVGVLLIRASSFAVCLPE
jgi:hypothetical protein